MKQRPDIPPKLPEKAICYMILCAETARHVFQAPTGSAVTASLTESSTEDHLSTGKFTGNRRRATTSPLLSETKASSATSILNTDAGTLDNVNTSKTTESVPMKTESISLSTALLTIEPSAAQCVSTGDTSVSTPNENMSSARSSTEQDKDTSGQEKSIETVNWAADITREAQVWYKKGHKLLQGLPEFEGKER